VTAKILLDLTQRLPV